MDWCSCLCCCPTLVSVLTIAPLLLICFTPGPFSQSLEDEVSIHSSFTPSFNHRRGSTSSTASRRPPFIRSMNDSSEFRGPNENTKLL